MTTQASYSLDQLSSFLAVVDEGSFSAAGRRLGRVQSAISYGIAQLESALGTRLFERDGRAPVLTDAGHRLSAEARLVLGQVRELAECAASLHAGVESELHVVVDSAYPSERLVEVCAAFRDQFPVTLLRLDVGLLNDPLEAVRSGAADFGVCNLAWTTPKDLAVAYLGSVRIVPVCAPHHPLATRPRPQRASALEQAIQIVHTERAPETRDQGVIAPRTWRVTDQALKLDLIRAGVGWGSLPRGLAAPFIARGELVELAPEVWRPGGHQLWIHAVMRKDRTLNRAGQWMREQLRLDDADMPRPPPPTRTRAPRSKRQAR
ncbi:MAG TPA: LysR family transcriptional regulator [Kofleriaceae bacterium]|jgi:DNA-binding transcriptional LysR family regulator